MAEDTPTSLLPDNYQEHYGQFFQTPPPTLGPTFPGLRIGSEGEQLAQHNLVATGARSLLEGILGPYHAFTRAWEDESQGQRASPQDMLQVALPTVGMNRLPTTSRVPDRNPTIMGGGSVNDPQVNPYSARGLVQEGGDAIRTRETIPGLDPVNLRPPGEAANTNAPGPQVVPSDLTKGPVRGGGNYVRNPAVDIPEIQEHIHGMWNRGSTPQQIARSVNDVFELTHPNSRAGETSLRGRVTAATIKAYLERIHQDRARTTTGPQSIGTTYPSLESLRATDWVVPKTE